MVVEDSSKWLVRRITKLQKDTFRSYVFIILTVVMASWVYAYVKTYQMAHFTCSLSHINYTSIKLFKNYKEKIIGLCQGQPKAAWEGPQSTTVLPAEAPTQGLHGAPVAPTVSELEGVSICSKCHFTSCEVTCSCCSPYLRSMVGGSTSDPPPSFQGDSLCQYWTLTDTGGRKAIHSFERSPTLN